MCISIVKPDVSFNHLSKFKDDMRYTTRQTDRQTERSPEVQSRETSNVLLYLLQNPGHGIFPALGPSTGSYAQHPSRQTSNIGTAVLYVQESLTQLMY